VTEDPSVLCRKAERLGSVAALEADDRGHIVGKQGVEHLELHSDGEGEQVLRAAPASCV
jgi:hypothetical protein